MEPCKDAAGALLSVWTDPKTLRAGGQLTFDAWALLLRTGVNPAALSAPQAALQLSKVRRPGWLADLQDRHCSVVRRAVARAGIATHWLLAHSCPR